MASQFKILSQTRKVLKDSIIHVKTEQIYAPQNRGICLWMWPFSLCFCCRTSSSYLQSRSHPKAWFLYCLWLVHWQPRVGWSTFSCRWCPLWWCNPQAGTPRTSALSAWMWQSWGRHWQTKAWMPLAFDSWSWWFPVAVCTEKKKTAIKVRAATALQNVLYLSQFQTRRILEKQWGKMSAVQTNFISLFYLLGFGFLFPRECELNWGECQALHRVLHASHPSVCLMQDHSSHLSERLV